MLVFVALTPSALLFVLAIMVIMDKIVNLDVLVLYLLALGVDLANLGCAFAIMDTGEKLA